MTQPAVLNAPRDEWIDPPAAAGPLRLHVYDQPVKGKARRSYGLLTVAAAAWLRNHDVERVQPRVHPRDRRAVRLIAGEGSKVGRYSQRQWAISSAALRRIAPNGTVIDLFPAGDGTPDLVGRIPDDVDLPALEEEY